MLVELRPKTYPYTATLYMKAGDRITTTTAGGDTPSPVEATGKHYYLLLKFIRCLTLYVHSRYDL